MITLTYQELVAVMTDWNAELLANPDGFETDPANFKPESQADYFIETLNKIKEQTK